MDMIWEWIYQTSDFIGIAVWFMDCYTRYNYWGALIVMTAGLPKTTTTKKTVVSESAGVWMIAGSVNETRVWVGALPLHHLCKCINKHQNYY